MLGCGAETVRFRLFTAPAANAPLVLLVLLQVLLIPLAHLRGLLGGPL